MNDRPQEYWSALDTLVEDSHIVVDRPKGSSHPAFHKLTYPLDYGYLAETSSGDGKEIDVWLSAAHERLVTAVTCTVDLHKRDVEIKLLLGCTHGEIAAVHQFLSGEAGLPCLLIERGNLHRLLPPMMRMRRVRNATR